MKKEKANIERLKNRIKDDKVKAGEASMSHYSANPSQAAQDQNPVTSPASREHGDYSQGSAVKQNVVADNLGRDGRDADAKGDNAVSQGQ